MTDEEAEMFEEILTRWSEMGEVHAVRVGNRVVFADLASHAFPPCLVCGAMATDPEAVESCERQNDLERERIRLVAEADQLSAWREELIEAGVDPSELLSVKYPDEEPAA